MNRSRRKSYIRRIRTGDNFGLNSKGRNRPSRAESVGSFQEPQQQDISLKSQAARRTAVRWWIRLHTPLRIIYSDNISPDSQTGIGAWSLEAFTRAMREGVAPDGSHLLPAFPHYAFTKLLNDSQHNR